MLVYYYNDSTGDFSAIVVNVNMSLPLAKYRVDFGNIVLQRLDGHYKMPVTTRASII